MRLSKSYVSFILLAVMAVVLAGLQYTDAAEQEYIPKAKEITLVETPLDGVEGKTVIIKQFRIPARQCRRVAYPHWSRLCLCS